MVQLIKNSLLSLAIVAASAFSFAFVAFAQTTYAANIQGCVNSGVNDLKIDPTCPNSGTANADGNKLNDLITDIINVFSVIVGIVAVVMLIFGGFRYVTSGGDSGKITSAKNTIVYAIVGLVIVALSQAVVQFVLSKLA